MVTVLGGPQRPLSPDLFDAKHGVKMGVPTDGCDDGKTALTVDWSGDSLNYTCFYPTKPFIPDSSIRSNLHCDNVPKGFYPRMCLFNKYLKYQFHNNFYSRTFLYEANNSIQ